jgi:hypothetical protein
MILFLPNCLTSPVEETILRFVNVVLRDPKGTTYHSSWIQSCSEAAPDSMEISLAPFHSSWYSTQSASSSDDKEGATPFQLYHGIKMLGDTRRKHQYAHHLWLRDGSQWAGGWRHKSVIQRMGWFPTNLWLSVFMCPKAARLGHQTVYARVVKWKMRHGCHMLWKCWRKWSWIIMIKSDPRRCNSCSGSFLRALAKISGLGSWGFCMCDS